MKRILNSALFACAVAISPAALAAESDCYKVSEAVTKAVTAKPSDVLAIVAREIGTSPACACEIVKAAIVATEADRDLVGQIVGVAIEAAPDQIKTVTNCAVAVAPDALPKIQAVVKKLNLQIGVSSAKDVIGAKDVTGSKDAKAPVETGAGVRNPLDEIYLIPGLPPIHPPLVSSTCTPDEFPNIDIID